MKNRKRKGFALLFTAAVLTYVGLGWLAVLVGIVGAVMAGLRFLFVVAFVVGGAAFGSMWLGIIAGLMALVVVYE